MKFLSFALFGVTALGANNIPPDNCPRLPEASSLTWQQSVLKHGVSCYAIRADKTVAFGLYLGRIPVDMPPDASLIDSGLVAGIPVRWVRAHGQGSLQAFGQQGEMHLHAFVPESKQDTVKEQIRLLSEITLGKAP